MRNVLKSGATERVRTVDLYLGKVPLYQLSYSRIPYSAPSRAAYFTARLQARAIASRSSLFAHDGPGSPQIIEHRPQRQHDGDQQ